MKRRRPRGAGYVYPLPSGEWKTSRTDQGVDFVNKSASSRILAIGRAKILSTGAPGWPGSGGVLYELLDGPRQGQVVYSFENVKPHVRAGQEVRAGQVIATMKGTGYPWLEMGWANRSGEPLSHSEYSEGMETKSGKAFGAFLNKLKSSGGSGGGGFSSFGPLGTAEEIIAAPIDAAAAPIENLIPKIPSPSEIAKAVIDGILGDVAKSAEPLMLNIGLVGGGAFLVYYGAALMLGVKSPGAKLAAPITKGPMP